MRVGLLRNEREDLGVLVIAWMEYWADRETVGMMTGIPRQSFRAYM